MAGFYTVEHDQMAHPLFRIVGRPLTPWEAYSTLLDQATFSQRQDGLVTLKRGDLLVSFRTLASNWRWSKAGVQRFIKSLEKHGFVTVRVLDQAGTPTGTPTDTPRTIITICNYAKISLQNNETGTPTGTPTGTHKGEERVIRKEKKETPLRESVAQGDLLGGAKVVAIAAVDDIQLAFDAYNALADQYGLHRASALTPVRRRKIRSALTQVGGMEGWSMVMEKIKISDFITSKRWAAFCLDDVLTPGKLVKIVEEVYVGRAKEQSPTESRFAREQREYFDSQYPVGKKDAK